MRNKQRSERTSASINIDIEQAWQHLELLDPEAPAFTFQTFDDNKKRGSRALARVFNGPLEEFTKEFERLQKRGAGIFVTVNETSLSGRRNENMRRARCIWQEDDDGQQGDFPLPPSLVIKTSPGKHHRYWLLAKGEELSRREHAAIIDRMVQDYGSDKGAKGFNRVMRLAGYLHQKGEPFQTHIVEASGKR